MNYKIENKTIVITNELTPDEMSFISSLAGNGFDIITATNEPVKKTRKKRKGTNPSKGHNRQYYKGQLTDSQYETFEKKIKESNFLSARKWADEQLNSNKK